MGFIIAAIVIIIILSLILMRFRLLLSFEDGKINVHLRILLLKFEIFGSKKEKPNKNDFTVTKFRKRRDKVLKKYKIKKAPEKDVSEIASKKKGSPIRLIRDLKDILIELIKLFGKHLRIDRFRIKIDVGGKDAASVALNYGYVIQALQYFVTFLEHVSNLDKTTKKSAEVNADFATEKWDASIDIEVSLWVMHALKIAIKAYSEYLKYKNSKKKSGNK